VLIDDSNTCNLINILYDGFVFGGYFKGWQDIIMSRGAYLLTLANLGVTVINAYDDITEPTTYTWESV
jgi:hypothetical protein